MTSQDERGERFFCSESACPGASKPHDAHVVLPGQEFKARVAALLKRIEFCLSDGETRCDICRASGQHEDDCELAAILKEAEG